MITVGSTAPSTQQAGNSGRLFTLSVVLAGAPAGSVFTKVRAKMKNDGGSIVNARVVVYSGTALVDWAAFTIPASAPITIFETTLTGAVTVTNGTYKIGVQCAHPDGLFYITTGTADTTSFQDTTYGSAPPNPWTPSNTFAWSSAFEADVDTPAVGAAFVPRVTVIS